MSLTDGSGLSAADVAAVTRGDGFGGFGGDSAWWLIVLFLFIFNGNWGNWGGGYGNGGVGSEVQRGFDQSAVAPEYEDTSVIDQQILTYTGPDHADPNAKD